MTERETIDAMEQFARARILETPGAQGKALCALLYEHIWPFVTTTPTDVLHRNANAALRRFIEQWETHPDFPVERVEVTEDTKDTP